jgi:hypothetical protein
MTFSKQGSPKMLSSIRALPLALLLVLFSLPAAADDSSPAPTWVDRFAFKGDLRLRHETIDIQDVETRRRMRFRTRFGFTADVADNVDFVLSIASGGDDPVSTNQNFGDGFTTKDLGIDLAYINWAAMDGLNIYAGKMKNPLFKAGKVPLVWDSDLNPEGIAASYKAGIFFANAGGFTIQERAIGDDSFLYAGQVGVKLALGDSGKLTAGIGHFAYTNTVGNTPFYNGRPKGNSVSIANNYLYDYKTSEVFAQFDTQLFDLPFQIFGHFVQNSEVSDQDTGYSFGVNLGNAKKQGEQQFYWIFQDIEADAVVATFNDSDFGGGGTDSSGHMVKYRYMLRDKIALGGTLFINQIGQNLLGTERDYNRLQLDVEFLFN